MPDPTTPAAHGPHVTWRDLARLSLTHPRQYAREIVMAVEAVAGFNRGALHDVEGKVLDQVEAALHAAEEAKAHAR